MHVPFCPHSQYEDPDEQPRRPFRDHIRQTVEAARQVGRDARDKQVVELGQRAVDDQVPGWVDRWLDHDRSEPDAVMAPIDEGAEP